MTEPCELPARVLRGLIGARRLSPRELLESCIARVEACDGVVNAIPIRTYDLARAEAARAEAAVMAGEALGSLHGLPMGVKDLHHVGGVRTTFGSPLFEDFVPQADDRPVAALRAAGALVLGKTNTTEFGAGSNTTNDVFGPTRNPFDPALTSGGSSGGAAAALACDMALLCTGSDTGGSLRVPSTFCGTAAIRPSTGVVPYERRAFAYSPFQVIGPMARDVGDLALMFGVMAEPDAMDPMSQALPRPPEARPVDLSSLRIAFSADLGFAPTSRMVRRVFANRVARLAPFFAVCEEAHPSLAGAVEANWVLRGLQFLHQHRERYERHREKLGPLVIENIEAAMTITAEQVARAMAEQNRLHQAFAAFFGRFAILVCPGATRGPFPVEDLAPREIDGEPQGTYVRWAGLTNGLSVAANPVVALPCGRDEDGLPFGLQIVGPRNGDWHLLSVAATIEEAWAADPVLARPQPDLHRLRAVAP